VSYSSEARKLSERSEAMHLFFAISEGLNDKAKELLVAGVNPNFRDYQSRCPLHIAAGIGNLSLIELLLEHRADISAMDHGGQTPLEQCQRGRHIKAEQLLKKNGAKINIDSLRIRAVGENWAVNRNEVHLEQELIRTLKSSVHRATWNGVDVVAKFAVRDEDSPEDVEDQLLHEINLLTFLRHPNLVLFLGCCLAESPIMFISEYMSGGDLEQYYRDKRDGNEGKPWAPNEKLVHRWSVQILHALNFLHNCAQPVIHRDLKPPNLLLTDNHDVKVTDFGISKVTDMRLLPSATISTTPKDFATAHREEPSSKQVSGPQRQMTSGPQRQMTPYLMTGGVGSWRYMAPEVARHDRYTEKVDVFSFAYVLYFLSCGKQPLHEFKDPLDILTEYCEGKEPRPRSSDCPPSFRTVMEAGWACSVEKRPSAAELAERLADKYPAAGSNCACAVS